MAGRTRRFGFNFFGGTTAGSLGEEQGKFTGADRQLLDAVLSAMESHDHTYRAPVPAPAAAAAAVVGENGSLQAGQTRSYVFTFMDADGLESARSNEVTVTLPTILAQPAAPQTFTNPSAGATLDGLFYYAITALRGTEESVLSTPALARAVPGESVQLTLPALGEATSFRIWRMGTTEGGFTKIGTSSTGTFIDTGVVPADPCACDPGNLPPTSNTGIAKYSVVVSLATIDATLVGSGAVRAWRLYGTSTPGVYSAASLIHEVVETVDEMDPNSGLLSSWEDVGDAPSTGVPPLLSTTLAIPEYTIPGAATLPLASGYPENYPLIVDGQLYVIDNGAWVTPIGGGGGGGNGGLVEGTTSVVVGSGVTEADALAVNQSVFVGAIQNLHDRLDGGTGYGATLVGGGATVLRSALLSGGGTSDFEQTAVGWFAAAADQAVAVGSQAFANREAVAIGDASYANSPSDVVIGAEAGSSTYLEGASTFISNSGGVTYGTAGNGTVPVVDPKTGLAGTYEVVVVMYTSLGVPLYRMTFTVDPTSFAAAATASFTVTANLTSPQVTELAGGYVAFYLHDEETSPHPFPDSFRGTFLGTVDTPATTNAVTVTAYIKGSQDVTLFDPTPTAEKAAVAIGRAAYVEDIAVQATAVGSYTGAFHARTTVIGTEAVSERANEVVLGTATEVVRVPSGRVELTASRMALGITELGNGIVRDLDLPDAKRVTERTFWHYQGATVVGALNQRWYNEFGEAATLLTARASMGTAPTGASAIVQVMVNGASVLTLTITAGQSTVSATGLALSIAAGAYVTLNVTQVGSTVAGADLTVQLGLGF